MAVVTLEDLQGTLEVVVFPKTYETTIGTWRDGAILLVAGRVDHRGDEASLLADSVWDWDAVAGARARGVRAGGRGRWTSARRGGAGEARRRADSGGERRRRRTVAAATATWTAAPTAAPPDARPDLLGAARPRSRRRRADGTDEPEEPPLPDEAALACRGGRPGPVTPVEAAPGAVLNVRFARDAGHGPRRVGDAGVQGRAPRAAGCDARRRPRAGARAATRCRWSCGASPTTRSWSPRCAAAWATGVIDLQLA